MRRLTAWVAMTGCLTSGQAWAAGPRGAGTDRAIENYAMPLDQASQPGDAQATVNRNAALQEAMEKPPVPADADDRPFVNPSWGKPEVTYEKRKPNDDHTWETTRFKYPNGLELTIVHEDISFLNSKLNYRLVHTGTRRYLYDVRNKKRIRGHEYLRITTTPLGPDEKGVTHQSEQEWIDTYLEGKNSGRTGYAEHSTSFDDTGSNKNGRRVTTRLRTEWTGQVEPASREDSSEQWENSDGVLHSRTSIRHVTTHTFDKQGRISGGSDDVVSQIRTYYRDGGLNEDYQFVTQKPFWVFYPGGKPSTIYVKGTVHTRRENFAPDGSLERLEIDGKKTSPQELRRKRAQREGEA